MVWIIVVGVILVGGAVLFASRRMKVLRSKAQLEQEMEGVLSSFRDLKSKVAGSDIAANEKAKLTGNIDRNLETLERWKSTAIPNITFWKNHTEPIEKEFTDMRESVDRELAGYNV